MPMRPISIVQIMISFPGVLSNGLKLRLNPTVLNAETASNVSVNKEAPFSVTDSSQTDSASQQK